MSDARTIAGHIVEIRTAQGLLLIGSPSSGGLGRLQVDLGQSRPALDAFALRSLLTRDPDALHRLRAAWGRFGLASLPASLLDRDFIEAVVRTITQRQVAALFLPGRPDAQAHQTLPPFATSSAPPPAGTAAKPARPVSAWSTSEKIEEALRRTAPLLTGELRKAFLALLTPQSIAITVAAFVALAVAQFFGVGEVAATGLAVIAYAMAGLAGVHALYDMVTASVAAARASTSPELDAVAQRYASDFTTLGMAFLTVMLARMGTKKPGGSGTQAEPAPEPEPPPKTPAPRTTVARTRLPRTNGHWDGEPGESNWYSDNPAVNAVTDNQPIPFKDGRPDFSEWSRGDIEFEPGTLDGSQNDFTEVYKYIQEQKGLPNQTAAKQLLSDLGLTPHHLDANTIQLIPTDLHGNIPHIGSAADLRGGP